MSLISAITAVLLGGPMYTMAPVPQEPPEDPMARGYMGITVATNALTIERVEPKTPAAKAGLRAGDVLVRLGTLQPHNFDEVVAHVTSFRPGALLEIEVQRGNDRKTFKLKLGSRPPELDVPRHFPDEVVPIP